MKERSFKGVGAALIVSVNVLAFVMALHPSGGSMTLIIKAASSIIAVHAIALLAIPVCLFGFRGLSDLFLQDRALSRLAFCFMQCGFIAALCAAAINGLALPVFLSRYATATDEVKTAVRPFISYNTALNQAFDYIFITAIAIGIFLFSLAILRKKEMPRWLGWYGLFAGGGIIVLLLTGFVLVDLRGFRLFLLALIVWMLSAGITLLKRR